MLYLLFYYILYYSTLKCVVIKLDQVIDNEHETDQGILIDATHNLGSGIEIHDTE